MTPGDFYQFHRYSSWNQSLPWMAPHVGKIVEVTSTHICVDLYFLNLSVAPGITLTIDIFESLNPRLLSPLEVFIAGYPNENR